MRFLRYDAGNGAALALEIIEHGSGGRLIALSSLDPALPTDLTAIIAGGKAMLDRIASLADSGAGENLDRGAIKLLNPFPAPGKIICIGLNYDEHAKETKLATTSFPTVFSRFNSTLLDPEAPILRAHVSAAFDYEVELVAVIGRPAHYVSLEDALDHVAGYTVANDVSVRDYQFATSQFTIGKNFDATCPLGPVFVTADALPAGGRGLRLSTSLNGQVVQDDTTDNMIFDVATLVQKLSEVMSLDTGDVILTGTPSGIGHARTPPLYLQDGDVVECMVERICTLRNPVHDETPG